MVRIGGCTCVLALSVVLGALPATSAEDSEAMARIEGVLYIDGQPASGKVKLEYLDRARSGDAPDAVTTGADGSFAFSAVQPGGVRVGWFREMTVRRGDGAFPSWTSSHTNTLFLEPGESVHIDIGKGGRTVTGKMVVPEDSDLEVDWLNASTRRLSADISWPAAPEGLSREERSEWYKKFRESEEGQELQETQRMYVVDVDQDGSFRVNNVAPGAYTLWIDVAKYGADGELLVTGQVAEAVSVPTGDGEDPIDVGTLPAKLYKQLAVGDAAPDFQATTLDGKTITLADFAGKYLLLDFWATWCGPCIGEMPHMKELYAEYGDNPKFAMVGLSLDGDKSALEQYVAKEELGWIQGHLGKWSETDVPDYFGVRGIPSVFLIGPDGKILEKKLRGSRTADAVAKALGE